MSVYIHCDGPNCERMSYGSSRRWLTVIQANPMISENAEMNFCSWKCVKDKADVRIEFQQRLAVGSTDG